MAETWILNSEWTHAIGPTPTPPPGVQILLNSWTFGQFLGTGYYTFLNNLTLTNDEDTTIVYFNSSEKYFYDLSPSGSNELVFEESPTGDLLTWLETNAVKEEPTGPYLIQAETLTDIADAIRSKTGDTDPILVADMADEIESIPVQKEEETKTVELDMASGDQTVSPTTGKVLTGVTITKPDTLIAANIRQGVTIGGVEGNLAPDKPDQSKTVDPSTEQQIVVADTGYELAQVTVNAMPAGELALPTFTGGAIVSSIEDAGYIGAAETASVYPVDLEPNLVAANIPEGVTLFGVEGEYVTEYPEAETASF